jgi:hypothetical protein
MAFVATASKNTSPLPGLLGEARTDEGVQEVLGIAAEDPKMAKLLAQGLLEAETEDEAAAAFAAVKEASVTAGTDDPEVIMRARLDSVVARFVMGGELAMASIKDQFNRDAAAATTEQALGQALNAAAQAADAKKDELYEALTEAVAPLAGTYDLDPAKTTITTALAAGRAEVRLTHSYKRSQMQAREASTVLAEALAAASSSDEIQTLKAEAVEFATQATTALDTELTEIVAEASEVEGLADRMEDLQAYADEIRLAQSVALENAAASEEIEAIAAVTRVSI